MTWQRRDAIPKEKRAPGKTVEPTEDTPRELPGAHDPEKVPTYVQSDAWMREEEDEKPFTFTPMQQRQLMEEGIWPEHQWPIWRHIMTRGIQAY